jgi:hypothetical protein
MYPLFTDTEEYAVPKIDVRVDVTVPRTTSFIPEPPEPYVGVLSAVAPGDFAPPPPPALVHEHPPPPALPAVYVVFPGYTLLFTALPPETTVDPVPQAPPPPPDPPLPPLLLVEQVEI